MSYTTLYEQGQAAGYANSDNVYTDKCKLLPALDEQYVLVRIGELITDGAECLRFSHRNLGQLEWRTVHNGRGIRVYAYHRLIRRKKYWHEL